MAISPKGEDGLWYTFQKKHSRGVRAEDSTKLLEQAKVDDSSTFLKANMSDIHDESSANKWLGTVKKKHAILKDKPKGGAEFPVTDVTMMLLQETA